MTTVAREIHSKQLLPFLSQLTMFYRTADTLCHTTTYRKGKSNARGHFPRWRPTNLRTSWTTTIFPLLGHVVHPDRHKYERFAVDTLRACFLSWCPNSRSRTIFPSPCSVPRCRSWWILSRHGRLPTKDLPFHTHVIILFTEYRSTFSLLEGRRRERRRRKERKGELLVW